jgi:hypothetical protein
MKKESENSHYIYERIILHLFTFFSLKMSQYLKNNNN